MGGVGLRNGFSSVGKLAPGTIWGCCHRVCALLRNPRSAQCSISRTPSGPAQETDSITPISELYISVYITAKNGMRDSRFLARWVFFLKLHCAENAGYLSE